MIKDYLAFGDALTCLIWDAPSFSPEGISEHQITAWVQTRTNILLTYLKIRGIQLSKQILKYVGATKTGAA